MVRVTITDSQVFSSIKPEALTRYLGVNGWHEARRVEGELVVLRKANHLVWLPISDQFSDYESMVARLVKTVAESEDKSELQILDDLQTVAIGDIIRVGTFNPLDAHDHTIALADGLHLLSQAKTMASAAAFSVIDKRPVYPRKPVSQVSQFIHNLKLAQTERGSFLVRLIAPVEPLEPSGGLDTKLPFSRQAVIQLMTGLKALKEVAEDNNKRGKFIFPSFMEAVNEGVSANLCEGVISGKDKSRPINVGVTWSYALPQQTNLPTSHIFFEPDIVQFIRKAAKEFRARNPEPVDIQGWTNVLEREKQSKTGSIKILSISNGKRVTVRVQLDLEDYNRAFEAQKKGDFVSVQGVLVKEGLGYRLNNPTNFHVIEQSELL